MQPTRSNYYGLEPAYLGTYSSESLSSYIVRLAEAHFISVGKLIDQAIVPILNKHYLNEYAKNGGTGFYKWSYLVNGKGLIAQDFVAAIETMTMRKDIYVTTLIGLATVLSDKGLMRRNRAWCRLCLSGQQRNGSLSESLLWNIKCVTCCPVHEVYLEEHCWRCGNGSTILNRRQQNGFCPHCHAWLGSNVKPEGQVSEADRYIAWEVSGLIADMHNMVSVVKRENIVTTLNSLSERFAQGKLRRFSEMMGLPHITVRGWCKEEHNSDLRCILKICGKSNITLTEFLSGDTSRARLDTGGEWAFPIVTGIRKRKMNWYKIGQQLEKETASGMIPRSLTTVASYLKVDRKLLTQRFPEICTRIKGQYQNFISGAALRRSNDCQATLRRTMGELLSSGIYPSRRRVEAAVLQAAFLRDPNLQDYWSFLKSDRYGDPKEFE